VRDKRSMLDFLWTMLNPLLTMLALTIVFLILFRFQIANYPVYLLSGTLLYGFIEWSTSPSIHNSIWGGGLMGKNTPAEDDSCGFLRAARAIGIRCCNRCECRHSDC
jgi:ABC-type polysaccharide/polyol phosphate export permease